MRCILVLSEAHCICRKRLTVTGGRKANSVQDIPCTALALGSCTHSKLPCHHWCRLLHQQSTSALRNMACLRWHVHKVIMQMYQAVRVNHNSHMTHKVNSIGMHATFLSTCHLPITPPRQQYCCRKRLRLLSCCRSQAPWQHCTALYNPLKEDKLHLSMSTALTCNTCKAFIHRSTVVSAGSTHNPWCTSATFPSTFGLKIHAGTASVQHVQMHRISCCATCCSQTHRQLSTTRPAALLLVAHARPSIVFGIACSAGACGILSSPS